MNSSEIDFIQKSIAAHPPVIIGALLLFQCIKRGMYYSHKKKLESKPVNQISNTTNTNTSKSEVVPEESLA